MDVFCMMKPRSRRNSRRNCPDPATFVLKFVALVIVAMPICISSLSADDRNSSPVEFNRDIRPILSDNCYQCHGPDKAQRKAELRLDTETGAHVDLGGRRALAPGDLEHSELYRRLIAEDET